MKIFTGLLVFVCCITYGSGTFRALKQAARAASFIQAATTRLNPVNLAASPIVVPQVVPVPTVYSRPVSTFSAQVSTYTSDLPPPPPPPPAYHPPVSSYRPPSLVYGPPPPIASYNRPFYAPYCETEDIPFIIEAW